MRALALVLALAAGAAHAGEPLRAELITGQCRLRAEAQGSWWLQYPGAELAVAPMRANCLQLSLAAIAAELGGTHFGWRAAYVDLGSVTLREDAFGGVGVQPHWSATGRGETAGASFGGFVRHELARGLSAELEGGALAYRSTWQAMAYHSSHDVTVPVAPPATYGATWYAGAGLTYRAGALAFSAALRRYADLRADPVGSNGDEIGPARASATALSIGLQVAL